jgi:excisionase family DNA binding protein
MPAPAPLPSASTAPLAVPPREAARLLSVSLSKIYTLMRTGQLDSFMDGGSRRITMSSIYAHIERGLASADDGDTRYQHVPPIRRGWQKASGERG